jgi:hypothetical protein
VPCFTPVHSPESNSIAEAFVKTFKRDYEHTSIAGCCYGAPADRQVAASIKGVAGASCAFARASSSGIRRLRCCRKIAHVLTRPLVGGVLVLAIAIVVASALPRHTHRLYRLKRQTGRLREVAADTRSPWGSRRVTITGVKVLISS